MIPLGAISTQTVSNSNSQQEKSLNKLSFQNEAYNQYMTSSPFHHELTPNGFRKGLLLKKPRVKLGLHIGSWQLRVVVLDARYHILSYLTENGVEKGKVDITGAKSHMIDIESIEKDPNSSYADLSIGVNQSGYPFIIKLLSGEILTFSASSRNEALEWVAAINLVTKGVKIDFAYQTIEELTPAHLKNNSGSTTFNTENLIVNTAELIQLKEIRKKQSKKKISDNLDDIPDDLDDIPDDY